MYKPFSRVMERVSQKVLSPLVILSMEKTMVAMVISELKSFLDLKFFFFTNWILVLLTLIKLKCGTFSWKYFNIFFRN